MDKSLSAEEVQQIAGEPIRVLKYSALCNYKDIEDMFGKYKGVLLLYESTLNRGHWTCLKKMKNKTICFFDSYGYIPDDELHFTNIKFRRENCMDLPYLTALMYKSKYAIDYNDVQLQKFKDNINTCGRYCGLFLRCQDMDNIQFAKWLKSKDQNTDRLIVRLTEPFLI